MIESCKKRDGVTTPFSLEVPKEFPKPYPIFQNNSLNEETFQLGKKLFNDGKLAAHPDFSCASCHQQFAAFATFDHDFSHGVDNQFTKRNAPGLFNLAWRKELHWDGAISHIEQQPLAPITAPNEMGETLPNVLNKLKKDPEYPKLFARAFGTKEITTERLTKALAQYMGTIVSANSKYDKVKRGQANFTANELAGYNLFKSKNCVSCHTEPLFTDDKYHNTGLPINSFIKDFGRMKITNLKTDSLKFKTPSLRNLELTFPYSHDGRFDNIFNAVAHYRNVTKSPTLDPLLLPNGISLTNNEILLITDFLRTLTDNDLVNNPRFK